MGTLQKATKQTKVELEFNTRPVRLLHVEAINCLMNSLIRLFTGRWRTGSIDMQQQRTLEAACPQAVLQISTMAWLLVLLTCS